MISEPIFARDANGKIRVWRGEVEGSRWRSLTGVDGGSEIVSAWTFTPARSRPTDEAQALFEMNAQRDKLLAKDYRPSRDLVDVPRGSYIKPMLANAYPGWTGPCYIQPKLDGMRCLANADGLWSRGNKPIVAAPHIQDALKEFFKRFPRVVLDGEIYNHERHDDFNGLMSIARKQKTSADTLKISSEVLQYHIYDCFLMDDPGQEFVHRNSFINMRVKHATNLHKCIQFVRTYSCTSADDLNEFHIQMVLDGYEGSIVRLDRAYEQKRSHTLLKNKTFDDGEFKLLRIEEGQGNWAGYAKRAVCVTKDGIEFGAGIKGSKDFCQALLNDRAETYESVTIRYFGMTPDGSLRFPIAISFNEKGSLEPRPVIDSESTEQEF